MKKQSYQRILAVLISLMILLTAGMAIVGAGLLQTREDSPDILPEATDTADSDELLMASDLAPDPAKWFLPYDGDLTDADGNPVRLSALCGKTTILLFWSSWCPDCQVYLAGDFGAAVQTAQAAGAQVVLVCREGIRGDTREKAEAELMECGITGIPLYMDADAALFHTLGLRSVPSLAVFDSQGQLLRATADMPNADEMAQLLDAAQHPAQQTLAFLKQLIQAHEREQCSVLALEQVAWSEVDKYGVIKPASAETMPIQIESIVEKPSRDVAPSNWSVVGRYVLSGKIMGLLKDVQRGTGGEIQLTDGISQLLETERMVGVPLSGKRFDCGNKIGFLEANLHFGLGLLNRGGR